MFEADKSKSGEEEEWSSRLGKKKARVEVSNVESLGKMTVTQLRQQLQAAGLSGKGTKAMLQDRLAKFVEERDHRQQKHSNGNDRNRHEEDSEVILIPQRWSRNSGPLMRSPPSVTSSSMQSGPCFLGSLNVTATTAPFEGTVQRSDGVERASNLGSSGQRGSARIGVVPQREHEEAFETSLTQEDERALGDPEVRGTSLGTWWRHPGDHPTASYLQQSPQPRYSNPQPYHSSAMYNASRLSSRSSMENLYPLEMENSNHNNHNNHPWNPQEQELVGASDGLDGAYVEDGHTPRASAVSRASTAVLSNRSSQHLDSHEMIPMRDSRELDDVGDIPDHQNAGVGEKPVEGERQAEEDEDNGRTSSFTQRRSSGAQTDLFFRRSGTPDGTQETVRSSQFDSPPSRSQNSSSGGGLWGTLLNAGTRLFKSVAPGTPANSERKRKRDSH